MGAGYDFPVNPSGKQYTCDVVFPKITIRRMEEKIEGNGRHTYENVKNATDWPGQGSVTLLYNTMQQI